MHITALRVQIPYTLETHGTTITYIPGIEVVATLGAVGVLVGLDVSKGIVGEISVKMRLYNVMCHINYVQCNALECRGWGEGFSIIVWV